MRILKTKAILEETYRNNNSVIEISGDLLLKLQKIELEMLKDINNICNENNINIFLGGGTLLGAIRHKGFIPWDDDIDLNLQRKNVDSFIEIMNKQFKNVYDVQYRNENQYRPFIKIRKKGTILDEPDAIKRNEGISIDIFIVEDLPKQKLVYQVYGIICTIRLFIASCLSIYEIKNKEFINIIKSNKMSYINYRIKHAIGFIFSFTSYNKLIISNDRYFSKYFNNGAKIQNISVLMSYCFFVFMTYIK